MLAILATHPIQYQVPVWKALASSGRIPFEVMYLSDRGARPSFDAEFGETFAWDLPLLEGYPYRLLPSPPGSASAASFWRARLPRHVLKLAQPEVNALMVNGWQVAAYWQATFHAQRASIPVWLRGESNDLAPRSGPKSAARRLALGMLFSRVSRFLCIGGANRRLYQGFGVPSTRLCWAPYCVDNERFRASATALKPNRNRIRTRWKIPEGAKCLLFSGKLVEKKRPNDVLDAVASLLRRRQDLRDRIHVLFAGTGPLEEQLRQRATSMTAEFERNLVTFAGFLNQMEIPEAYEAADWLVLPSGSEETWGLVVNEALASGVPAIVSDLCGCAEDLVAPLGCQFIYGCGDISQLSAIVERVLTGEVSHPSEEECLDVVARYGVTATVATLVEEYEALC